MAEHNVDTASVFKWVLTGTTRLSWYARYCRKRRLSYRDFVKELELSRRDVLKTPDGIILDPESNDALDMVAISAAWRTLCTKHLHDLYRQ